MFTPVPPDHPRYAHMEKFLASPCTSAMTVKLDLSGLVPAARKAGLPVSHLLTYAVSYIVNGREEFRMGLDSDGQPGFWDEVHPCHNLFHEDSETYTTLFTRWTGDLHTFLSRMEEDLARAALLRVPAIPSPVPNTFEVSSVPWIHYENVSVQMENPSLSPMIVWGRWENRGEKIILPMTLQIHHAAADGFHMARFFTECQTLLDALARRILP